MPHDVETVEDHLVVGAGHFFVTGVDVRWPHVQADRLDLLPVFLREGVKVGRKTLFLAPLADVLNGRFFQIAHQRHVAVALCNGFLIDAHLSGHLRALGRPAPDDRSLHQVPGFVPSNAQNLGRLLHVGCQKDVNGQYLEQVRKATSHLRPRQCHLMYPVLRTRHARCSGMQVGEKLATVQVTPHPLSQVVIGAKLAPALRTAKALTRRMPDINLDMLPRHIQFNSLHRPRRRQPKQLPVQLHAVHRMSSLQAMRDSVLPTHREV